MAKTKEGTGIAKTQGQCNCHNLTNNQLENPGEHGIEIIPNSTQPGQTDNWFSVLLRCKKCNREWRNSFYTGGVFI